MTNKQIGRILRETGALIELTGGNTFRARAYQNASRIVERLDEPATRLIEREELHTVGGIGEGMAAQVKELVERGSFDLLDELLTTVPAGVVEILRIKGIGAKKARTLWQKLGIETLDQLEEAATIGRLAELPGFGAKTQESVLQNLRRFRENQHRRRYADAMALAEPFLNTLRITDGVRDASLTGDLRRAMETVDTAEYLVAATDPDQTADRLAATLPASDVVTDEGGVHIRTRLSDGFPLLVHIVSSSRFGSDLWRTTGSHAHCARFEREYGAVQTADSERLVYERAGLAYIEPELREDRGEFDAATDRLLPELIRLEELRGVLHNHSTYSDGAHSLQEMADAVRSRGFQYFGIADHSQSLTIANGMTAERVQRQQEEIRRMNATYEASGGSPFRVFSGIECDILGDGTLDFPDDVLATFDYVVASIHSRFNMTEREATERLVRAIENPYTTILGHATGRLLLIRDGYPIHHETVIDACAETGTAIEINANPRRLDMDWRWLHSAIEKGVMIAINPDAHSVEELDYLRWGVAAARKGWLTAAHCLNALELESFAAWLSAQRTTKKGASL